MYVEYCSEDGRPYVGPYSYRTDGGYVYEQHPAYLETRPAYYHDFAYDNPSSSSSSTNPRTPSRLLAGHRRTPSNVSNASSTNTSSSNVNPSFRLDDDEFSTPSRSARHFADTCPTEYYYMRQNSDTDRPGTLELSGRQLRSGMRKYSYSPAKPPSGWGSGAGTPTNPTPPDSLTSEDSSYVSAKEGSFSRVR